MSKTERYFITDPVPGRSQMTPAQIRAEIKLWRKRSWAKAKREGREYGPRAPLYVREAERQTEEAMRRELERR